MTHLVIFIFATFLFFQFLNLLASAWLLSDNMDLVACEEKRALELDLMSALHE